MTIQEKFRTEVEKALADTPYVVTPTEKGFDVHLDITSQHWYGIFGEHRLSRAFKHHVKVDADLNYFVVTDSFREVTWERGALRWAGSWTKIQGRIIRVETEKSWGIRSDGTLGKISDYTFSSEEGRRPIVHIGKSLGLSQRRGWAEAVGLYVGLFAIVGCIVMGILILTGVLPL